MLYSPWPLPPPLVQGHRLEAERERLPPSTPWLRSGGRLRGAAEVREQGASALRPFRGDSLPPPSLVLRGAVERWRSSSLRRPSGPTLLPSARPLCRACEPHTDGHRRRGRLGRFVGDDKRQKAGEMVGNIVFVMLGLG